MFYAIKRYLKGEQGTGLNFIKVPDQDIYWYLVSIGMAVIFGGKLIWTVSQSVTMLVSATYRITDFCTPSSQ
eukprot:7457663-Ditylum_brightwellii.AAC.1